MVSDADDVFVPSQSTLLGVAGKMGEGDSGI